VILHREGQIGPVHRPPLFLQSREGVVSMQLMEDMPVDIEQIAAVRALADTVKVPDLVEQSAWHGVAGYI
jgi:hypothetical protein